MIAPDLNDVSRGSLDRPPQERRLIEPLPDNSSIPAVAPKKPDQVFKTVAAFHNSLWRYKLLPLHFNFCRTTLKNETSGITASGRLCFAFRIATSASVFKRIGSRPSTVR